MCSNESEKEQIEYCKKHNELRQGYPSSTIIDGTAKILPGVKIGNNVRIGAGCAVGYNAFNYKRDNNFVPFLKPHEGSVVIEDNVELHGCVCVDKGLTDDTIIRRNVKIDNLVHVAHDVEIGKNSLIVAGTVLGGYSKIGKNCFVGINASIKPRIKIGDYSVIGMGSVVLEDVPPHEIWAGVPARKLKDNLYFK